VELLVAHREGIDRVSQVGGAWRVASALDREGVTCLAVHPTVAGLVYVGTRNGVLRSDDGGRSWREAGMDGRIVKSLAVTPAADDLVVAGTKPADVFLSRDGGGTWEACEGFARSRRWYWWSPAEPPDFRAYVMGLAVAPDDPDVIVAGIEAGGVVRSEDGGRTWSGHRRHADLDCHALCFHARDGRWVYEAGGGGPAVSRDGGVRWMHPHRGLTTRYGMAVAADGVRPEVWYLAAAPLFALSTFVSGPVGHTEGAARAALWRSSGGAAWERLAGGLPQPISSPPYGLATDPGSAGRVVLGLANGTLWRSEDHGDRWECLPVRARGVRHLAVAG
jgi:photosystem II stability/assembly factor-like uncharacterized protein